VGKAANVGYATAAFGSNDCSVIAASTITSSSDCETAATQFGYTWESDGNHNDRSGTHVSEATAVPKGCSVNTNNLIIFNSHVIGGSSGTYAPICSLTALSVNLSNESVACTACTAGRYASTAGQLSCSNCAYSTYQNSTGQASCAHCTAGKAAGLLSPPVFYRLPSKDSVCSVVAASILTTSVECETAATQLEYIWSDESVTAAATDKPTGCYVDTTPADSVVYYNPGTTGGAASGHFPICRVHYKRVLDNNKNDCSAINGRAITIMECQTTAAQLGYSWKEVTSAKSNRPKGCYVKDTTANSKVYWNPDPTGSASSSRYPICSLVGLSGESAACSTCAAGKYANTSGQLSCSTCTYSTYQTSAGQVSCTGCAAGKASHALPPYGVQRVTADNNNDCSVIYTGTSISSVGDCEAAVIELNTQGGGSTLYTSGGAILPDTTSRRRWSGSAARRRRSSSTVPGGCFADEYDASGSESRVQYNEDAGAGESGSYPICRITGFSTGQSDEPHACSICPTGRYSSAAAQVACSLCGAGLFAKGGSAAGQTEESEACDRCPAAKYQPATGQQSCLSCPIGRFASGEGVGQSNLTAACHPCPVGKYQPAVEQLNCTSCPAGKQGTTGAAITGCVDSTTWMSTIGKSCSGYATTVTAVSASMSSTYSSSLYAASKCIDGDHASKCSTQNKLDSWLKLDLGAQHAVSAVKIWNRADCCQERLGAHVIETSNDDASWTICFTGTLPSSVGPFTEACASSSARFVRVRLDGHSEYLNLGDVEVVGRGCDNATQDANGVPMGTACPVACGNCGFSTALIVGESDSNTCPNNTVKITTAAECKTAAASAEVQALGSLVGYVNSVDKSDVPAGCYIKELKHVWFNTHPTGSGSGERKPICITAQDLAVAAASAAMVAESVACEACPFARYSPTDGLENCMGCPAGRTTNRTAALGQVTEAAACEDCAQGKYTATTGQLSCTECETGRFEPAARQVVCIACPTGKAASGSATGHIAEDQACTNCTRNRFQNVSGQQTCKDCPAGSSAKAAPGGRARV
jgi:hypothetical protein